MSWPEIDSAGSLMLRWDSTLWTVAKVKQEYFHLLWSPNPVLCALCAPLCFKGSQIRVADLVLRPHVVILYGNRGCC